MVTPSIWCRSRGSRHSAGVASKSWSLPSGPRHHGPRTAGRGHGIFCTRALFHEVINSELQTKILPPRTHDIARIYLVGATCGSNRFPAIAVASSGSVSRSKLQPSVRPAEKAGFSLRDNKKVVPALTALRAVVDGVPETKQAAPATLRTVDSAPVAAA
jgi:hypothetical protein